MSGNILTRREAEEFLGFDSKTFSNFFKYAGEFSPLPRTGTHGRFYFDQDELKSWKSAYNQRTFTLKKSDYAACVDFALAMHFRGYVLSDWGTGRQREFGQKISNWARGQLGEIGLKYFCQKKLGFDIRLDFDMHDEIVPQDVLAIIKNGREIAPRNKIAVKSSKPKSNYLVLGENEVDLPERRSDVYVFTRVDLPDDHLLRIAPNELKELVKGQQHFTLYKDHIPEFQDINVEVAGFAWKKDLEKVSSIPGQEFEGLRYVKKTGGLRRSIEDWRSAIQ
jgi:hypothetical protein